MRIAAVVFSLFVGSLNGFLPILGHVYRVSISRLTIGKRKQPTFFRLSRLVNLEVLKHRAVVDGGPE